MARVAQSDGAPTRAREAQAEFYTRHVRYLYGAVQKRRQLLELAGESPEDLVQETFQRAFERAHTFRSLPGLEADHDRRRTRAWLGRIAHSLLADKLRGDLAAADSPYLERLAVEAEESVAAPSPALERVRRALASMSEREQDVLCVTALYYRVGGVSASAERTERAVPVAPPAPRIELSAAGCGDGCCAGASCAAASDDLGQCPSGRSCIDCGTPSGEAQAGKERFRLKLGSLALTP